MIGRHLTVDPNASAQFTGPAFKADRQQLVLRKMPV